MDVLWYRVSGDLLTRPPRKAIETAHLDSDATCRQKVLIAVVFISYNEYIL